MGWEDSVCSAQQCVHALGGGTVDMSEQSGSSHLGLTEPNPQQVQEEDDRTGDGCRQKGLEDLSGLGPH